MPKKKKYRFYWYNGKIETGEGESDAHAFKSLGHHSTELINLACYEEVKEIVKERG